MTSTAKHTRGSVSSAHPLASAAGLKVLKKGGNAVDAAVATSLALGVVAPAFSGLGGGGFFMVRLKDEQTRYIDYREVAPRRANPAMFEVDEQGEALDFANSMGHKSAGVPGTTAGLLRALQEFGTMKFSQVAEYAIEYARRGFEVSRFIGYIVANNVDNASLKFRSYPSTGSQWLRDGGRRPTRSGERKTSVDLASTLQTISKYGLDGFYGGSVAKSISTEMASHGGLIDEEDLRDYSVKLRDPVVTTYREYEIHTSPPPSKGGLTIVQALNILEGMDLGSMRLHSADQILLLARVLSVVWKGLDGKIGDPSFVEVDPSRLQSKEYASRLWFGRGERGFTTGSSASGGRTTHMSVIDAERNVAGVTESIECYFGSGVTPPGTGVLLNDTMHDFDPKSGGTNSVTPGARPVSNMSPTLLLRDGEPFLVLGSAGGPRIVTGVLQTILNVVDYGLPLQNAVDAPRIHYQGTGPVRVESRIGNATRSKLAKLGLETETPNYVQLRPGYDVYFGGVHAVMVGHRGEVLGAADARRQGSAVSY